MGKSGWRLTSDAQNYTSSQSSPPYLQEQNDTADPVRNDSFDERCGDRGRLLRSVHQLRRVDGLRRGGSDEGVPDAEDGVVLLECGCPLGSRKLMMRLGQQRQRYCRREMRCALCVVVWRCLG